MKVFLLKFFLFIIICCLIVMVCGSGRLDKKNQSDFMGAIIDKHRRLDSLTGSRIIFAGGSNLSLGQNSRLIEEEIKMPVVNLGLHAGLGLDFVLNELKSVIKSGDVVFLSIEYYLGKGDYKLQKHTAKGFPAAEDFIPITGFSQKIKYVIDKQMTNVHENAKYLFLKIKNDNNTPQEKVYDRKCFNKYGDDTAIYNITTTSILADRGGHGIQLLGWY